METDVDVRVKLTLTCFKGLDGRSAYNLYHTMRAWLGQRGVAHKFGWINTGNYIPDYLILDRGSAAIFKLKFI